MISTPKEGIRRLGQLAAVSPYLWPSPGLGGDLGCSDDKGNRAQRSTVRFAFAYPFINQPLHRRILKTGLHWYVKLRSAIAVVYQARTTSTAPANGLAATVVEFCGLNTRSENGQTTGHTRPLIEP